MNQLQKCLIFPTSLTLAGTLLLLLAWHVSVQIRKLSLDRTEHALVYIEPHATTSCDWIQPAQVEQMKAMGHGVEVIDKVHFAGVSMGGMIGP